MISLLTLTLISATVLSLVFVGVLPLVKRSARIENTFLAVLLGVIVPSLILIGTVRVLAFVISFFV